MQTKEILETVFNNESLITFAYNEEEMWFAAQISKVLGYSNTSRIGSLIRDKWSALFVEGKHYRVLTRKNINKISNLRELTLHWSVSPKARNYMVLTEPGVNRVLMLTKKKVGIQLRDHLDTVVLPQFRRGMIEEKDVEELKARQREEVAKLQRKIIERSDQVIAFAEYAKEREEALRALEAEVRAEAPYVQKQASAAGKALCAAKGTKAVRRILN